MASRFREDVLVAESRFARKKYRHFEGDVSLRNATMRQGFEVTGMSQYGPGSDLRSQLGLDMHASVVTLRAAIGVTGDGNRFIGRSSHLS
jgi:hypothetical protein